MKKIEISRFWYYTFIILIILISYFHFSAIYYPFLDFNTALTILMTPGFGIPGDLYMWGQNFSGSLIPFLAQILYLTYRFPPAMAVSIIHFAILIIGFLTLSTFFKTKFTKILLAMVWFLPVWHAIGQVTTISGIQLSAFVIGIYCLNRKQVALTLYRELMWLSLSCLSFLVSIWVSDLAFITLGLFIIYLLWMKKNSGLLKNPFTELSNRNHLYPFLIVSGTFLIGAGFLFYAKIHAAKTFSIYQPLFGSPETILVSCNLFFQSLIHILTFTAGNITESLFSWGTLAFIPWSITISKKRNPILPSEQTPNWYIFFLANAIVLLVFLLISNWVGINGTNRRYFSIVFISSAIALLFFTEASESAQPRTRKIVLFLLLGLGLLSSLIPLYFPEVLVAKNTALSDLKTMGTFGIIGETTAVTFSASVDPDHIKATPHDKEYIRNFSLVKGVFKQNRIYLIKQGWLTVFPDTIKQFGFILQRLGNSFHKGGYELCRYERIINRQIFTVNDLKYQGSVQTDTTSISGKVAVITSDFDRSKHFIYGPFIRLYQGKYTVVFRLRSSRDLSTSNVAVLEVSANFGKTILASRTIRLCDFAKRNHDEEFDFPFETTKAFDGVEFRIMFLGGTDLSFDRVVLAER